MFNFVHNSKTPPYFSYDDLGKHFVHSGKYRMYKACLSYDFWCYAVEIHFKHGYSTCLLEAD